MNSRVNKVQLRAAQSKRPLKVTQLCSLFQTVAWYLALCLRPAGRNRESQLPANIDALWELLHIPQVDKYKRCFAKQTSRKHTRLVPRSPGLVS